MREDLVFDPVRSQLDGQARALLEGLAQTGLEPRPDATLQKRDGWTVLVICFPSPASQELPPGLSECDRHCLSMLGQAQQPVSAKWIRRELERQRIEVYGIATVKRSLSKLKKLKLVLSSRKRPRGYSLANHLPLFDHPSPR
jgi:hypothetical protein